MCLKQRSATSGKVYADDTRDQEGEDWMRASDGMVGCAKSTRTDR